jgi:hypothetical protein
MFTACASLLELGILSESAFLVGKVKIEYDDNLVPSFVVLEIE